MITVKVFSRNSGKPVTGRKVVISFDSLIRGITSPQYTNDDGEAHFDADNGNGKVYVDGTTKYDGYLSDRIEVYI